MVYLFTDVLRRVAWQKSSRLVIDEHVDLISWMQSIDVVRLSGRLSLYLRRARGTYQLRFMYDTLAARAGH
jgi:hypothetical protein